jgi:citrate lyase subunit beta / citryl-CoA lyase
MHLKALAAGADEVILDLEDAVPQTLKDEARDAAVETLRQAPCWVRVNRPGTDACEKDLRALAGLVRGFRIPKVESAGEVASVARLAPDVPLDCTIESARGVLAASEIAASPRCSSLSYGGLDLAADLSIEAGDRETLVARSLLVLAARAASKPAPSDGVYVRLGDIEGLRADAESARRLGFFGKSAIHPEQVATINEVFSPRAGEREWAQRVLHAFSLANGAPTTVEGGEFVDEAVAARARAILGRERLG